MPSFEIDLPHSLPPDDVRSRIDGMVGKLEQDYGVRCAWEGERQLRVARRGLDGKLLIEDGRVRVEMSLGLLLTPLAGQIRSGITKQLTGLLGAPPASGS